jgi:hypothetical protein
MIAFLRSRWSAYRLWRVLAWIAAYEKEEALNESKG